MTTINPSHSVGYSILRTGEGASLEACIVMPHIDAPDAMSYDPISRRLDLKCGPIAISLPDMPGDIGKLLTGTPDKVLLVTTDAIASIRSSSTATALLHSVH